MLQRKILKTKKVKDYTFEIYQLGDLFYFKVYKNSDTIYARVFIFLKDCKKCWSKAYKSVNEGSPFEDIM